MNKHGLLRLVFMVLLLVVASNSSVFGSKIEDSNNNHLEVDNHYLPYLQIGGTRFFNVKQSNSAAGFDLFVPLWQSPNKLVFTDARFYDRSGAPFEGNLHVGYRYLSPKREHLYGIYGAFDRKRSELENYFSQLTLGGECWLGRVFMGGNFYQPIGDTQKYVNVTRESAVWDQVYRNIKITRDIRYEKAMGGGDAEVGYELVNGLVGYVGGYYFSAKDTDSIHGPKAKLSYDWSLEHGKKALGVFDKFGLEVGVQNDKSRGTTWYLSANFRIGLLPNRSSDLQGVARHMVDLVRRDVDIISTESTEQTEEIYTRNGKNVTVDVPQNQQELLAAIEHGSNIIFMKHQGDEAQIEVDGDKKQRIVFGRSLEILSSTGQILQVNLPSVGDSRDATRLVAAIRNLAQTNVGMIKRNGLRNKLSLLLDDQRLNINSDGINQEHSDHAVRQRSIFKEAIGDIDQVPTVKLNPTLAHEQPVQVIVQNQEAKESLVGSIGQEPLLAKDNDSSLAVMSDNTSIPITPDKENQSSQFLSEMMLKTGDMLLKSASDSHALLEVPGSVVSDVHPLITVNSGVSNTAKAIASDIHVLLNPTAGANTIARVLVDSASSVRSSLGTTVLSDSTAKVLIESTKDIHPVLATSSLTEGAAKVLVEDTKPVWAVTTGTDYIAKKTSQYLVNKLYSLPGLVDKIITQGIIFKILNLQHRVMQR